MKKLISIILICALIATLAIALVSCTNNENGEETNSPSILPPDLGGEESTENSTTSSDEDWGLGEVPLH